MQSKNERLLKEIITDQINNTWKNCWTEQVKDIIKKYDLSIEELITKEKKQLKILIENKINLGLQKQLNINKDNLTKQRFINEYKQKDYIKDLQFIQCITMLKIRLNMIEVKSNYKGTYKNTLKCELCKTEDDTTEHLLQCNVIFPNKPKLGVEDIIQCNSMIPNIIEEIMERRKYLGYEIKLTENP